VTFHAPVALWRGGVLFDDIWLRGGERALPTPRKEKLVADLTDALGRATMTIVADYRGLKVGDLQSLRAQLRPHNADVKVAKNTLAKIAARANSLEVLESELVGPTALVLAYDDVAQPAKIVNDFVRSSRILQIRSGLLEGQIIAADRIDEIASLPSRDVLIGKVVGGMTAPLYNIVGVLSAPTRSLLYVLQARASQLEASEAA
jgi:large subunit ribosomal protein L10